MKKQSSGYMGNQTIAGIAKKGQRKKAFFLHLNVLEIRGNMRVLELEFGTEQAERDKWEAAVLKVCF